MQKRRSAIIHPHCRFVIDCILMKRCDSRSIPAARRVVFDDAADKENPQLNTRATAGSISRVMQYGLSGVATSDGWPTNQRQTLGRMHTSDRCEGLDRLLFHFPFDAAVLLSRIISAVAAPPDHAFPLARRKPAGRVYAGTAGVA
jgi:hypothetical protein